MWGGSLSTQGGPWALRECLGGLQGRAGAALLLLGHSPLPFLSTDGEESGLNLG